MNHRDQATLLLADGVVIDAAGERIGRVGQVFVDPGSGRPDWITVRTGFFGNRESFVPLDDATLHGEEVRVPYDAAVIKGAPHHEVNGALTDEDEDDLHAYYAKVGAPEANSASTDTGSAEVTVIRYEERLRVGTEPTTSRKARLHKFVVTDEQTVTVPVSRHEVRLVREPITDANRAQVPAADELLEQSYEVVLFEDRVVVDKQTVPVERITMGTEVVTEQHPVTATVRTEQIEIVTDGVQSVLAPRPR